MHLGESMSAFATCTARTTTQSSTGTNSGAAASTAQRGNPHLLLRRASGSNQNTQRAATQPAIRAKLTVGQPGDALEQEADRVADAITGSAGAASGTSMGTGAKIHRSAAASAGNVPVVTNAQQNAIEAMRGGGMPLPGAARSTFEPHFGQQLGAVRIHTDERAAGLAAGLGARAFTVGNDIAFASGQFAPETREGRHLLAHELTHVAQNGGEATGINRDPAPGAKDTPKDDKKPAETPKPDDKPKLGSDPSVVNLFKEIGSDLNFGKDFTNEERDKFKLKGNESASYYGFAGALATPFSGMGGTKYNSNYDFSTNLGVFSRHLDAIEPLTPSLSLKTDLLSRPFGLRVDEYLASDRFLNRLKVHAPAVTGLVLLVQGVYSIAKGAPTPSPDIGGYITQPWADHLGLVKSVIGIVLKEPLKASSMFDLGPILLLSHPAFSADTAVGGNLPSGLRMDHAYSPDGKGSIEQGGLTLDPLKFLVPAFDSNVAAGDMSDPRKYRGPQLNIWGDYKRVIPSTAWQDAGRKPQADLRYGAIFGTGGAYVLLDVGKRYSGPEADKLTATFFGTGIGYAGGKDSVIKKIGFKVTSTQWNADDVLAPKTPAGTPQAGVGYRVQPFASLDFKPAPDKRISVGATLGVAGSSLGSTGISDFRGDISYTYLGTSGTEAMPMFRIELGVSRSRLDFWDPNSPVLTGLQGKAQVGRFFVGGQLNLGADAIPKERAAQAADPRADDPKAQVPGAGALIVTGYMF